MGTKSLFYRFTLGLLLGVLIMPAQPAQAQFGGIVHDLKGYALKVKHRAAEAREHMQVFDNAVKQLTTLRGVLVKAEELATNQLISKETMADIGIIVRTSIQLKEQNEALIKTRLTMLKSIDDRLSRGIFDPEADMRDLEDYLRTSIGRSSQDSLANLDRLRAMDNTLERLNNELEAAQEAASRAEGQKKALLALEDKLKKLNPQMRGTEGMNAIEVKKTSLDTMIMQYKSKIEELRHKIKERTEKYHVLMDERIKFGEEVDATNKGWSDFNDALDGIQRAFSGY